MKKENMDLNYWRSFQELHANDSFEKQTQDEFLAQANEAPEISKMSLMSRRKFVGLMSASAALAGTACSNYRDEGELIPYNNQTETTTPGVTYHYASSVSANGKTDAVLVKVREGRPIKLIGNTNHPLSKGGIDAPTQALMMSLYDPDRLKKPLLKNVKTTDAEIDIAIKKALVDAQSKNKKVILLGSKILSPVLKQLIDDTKAQYENTFLVQYDLYNKDYAINAQELVHGAGNTLKYKLDKARLIVSFESDFLGSESTANEKKEFAIGRDIVASGNQNKLIVVEGDMSLTGVNADLRIPVKSDAVDLILTGVLNEIVSTNAEAKSSIPSELLNKLSQYSLNKAKGIIKVDEKAVSKLVHEIKHNIGKTIIKVGKKLSLSAHIAGELLNKITASQELKTAQYSLNADYKVNSDEDLKALVTDLNQGNVGVLINLNTNPVFHFAGDLEFEKAITKADFSLSLVESTNETSVLTTAAVPINHTLESWGVSRALNGIVDLQQPVIAPIFKSRQLEDLLISYLGQKDYSDIAYRELIKSYVSTTVYSESRSLLTPAEFWVNTLHDGFAKIEVKPRENSNNFEAIDKLNPATPSKDMVVSFKASQYLGDAALANVGWLQEVPHPVSKITWDNYAAMSLATMKKLGLKKFPKSGDYSYEVVNVKVNNKVIQIPAFTQPGIAEDQVVIELGYGRSESGIVAKGVGVNAIPLMSINYSVSPFIFAGVSISSAGKFYDLASTQEHYAINAENMEGVASMLATRIEDAHLKRMIIQEGTIEDYNANPNFLHEHKHYPTTSLNRPHKYEGVKWAMSIDLNKCTGCGDCVIACNVENNIPVVGKDQVKIGREMHWIRIDRYYSGSTENPSASIQPMLCQHCDNAPCENVCPVVATTHSPEGINEMTYNRCVGTRYCANNCPYKVRRFNFFNFRDHFAGEHQEKPVFALLHNPEVSVRSRGVMEKCSFCVQRVNNARANSKRNHEEWNGQGMATACQESCSANAIAFGNLNDADSAVAVNKKHKLTYRVLDETGVESNVRYLAKIRNIEGKSHS